MELLSCEDRIVLAVDFLKSDASMSVRSVAARFCIHESTLWSRHARTTARCDTPPNSLKLTKSEEDSLVRRIRDLSLRGFAPSFTQVCSMADQLLAAHDGTCVGINWVDCFIKRRTEIKSQLSRPRDYCRILCSDISIIELWFSLVANVKAKYSILDEDTYNFDETGF
jgi:hypothetical protein